MRERDRQTDREMLIIDWISNYNCSLHCFLNIFIYTTRRTLWREKKVNSSVNFAGNTVSESEKSVVKNKNQRNIKFIKKWFLLKWINNII